MAWTMAQIKDANEKAGHYWFSAGAVRFFRSRIGTAVYEGPCGVFFVSSEQFEASNGERALRRYTVRQFCPETGRVDTASANDFNKLMRSQAIGLDGKLAVSTVED